MKLILFSLLIVAFEVLNFSNSTIVRRESVQVQPVNNTVTDTKNSSSPLPNKPQPECKMQCRPSPLKRGRECYIECHGELPATVRVAPILDQKCAEKCNGGPVGDYSNFKRECAVKCAIPERK
uniref:Uncharacterized protein n=1 Tax=Meloidogyne enterolobii TaxID=390850 RepID=A0A6V7VDL0_MELEN|nr:unnamed protein product [Meloidogyne enterolobii]